MVNVERDFAFRRPTVPGSGPGVPAHPSMLDGDHGKLQRQGAARQAATVSIVTGGDLVARGELTYVLTPDVLKIFAHPLVFILYLRLAVSPRHVHTSKTQSLDLLSFPERLATGSVWVAVLLLPTIRTTPLPADHQPHILICDDNRPTTQPVLQQWRLT